MRFATIDNNVAGYDTSTANVLNASNHKWVYLGFAYSKLMNRVDICKQSEVTDIYSCETMTGVTITILINNIIIGNLLY